MLFKIIFIFIFCFLVKAFLCETFLKYTYIQYLITNHFPVFQIYSTSC